MQEYGTKPPYEGGSGSVLEVIDMLCSVTEQMAQIIKRQAEVIEQEKIANAAVEDLKEEQDNVERKMNLIEYKMRRL